MKDNFAFCATENLRKHREALSDIENGVSGWPLTNTKLRMTITKRTGYIEKSLKRFFDALEQGKSERIEDRITEEDIQVARRLVDWAETHSKDIDLNFPDPKEPGKNYSIQFQSRKPRRPVFRIWSKRANEETGGAHDVEIFFVYYDGKFLFEDREKRKQFLERLFCLVPTLKQLYSNKLDVDGRKNVDYSTFAALEDFNGFTAWILEVIDEMKRERS